MIARQISRKPQPLLDQLGQFCGPNLFRDGLRQLIREQDVLGRLVICQPLGQDGPERRLLQRAPSRRTTHRQTSSP